jgi:uncharacterized membrane protein YbhN (UPF0104 family)
MERKRTLSLALSLLLMVIVAMVCYMERSTLLDLFTKARPVWLLTGFGCYLVNYLLRTCRLGILIESRTIPFGHLFRITCLHGFFSYFLPLRSGDLSLPLLLKKESGSTLVAGGAVLIKSRLLDMLSLGFFLTLSTVFSFRHITTHHLLLFAICSLGLIIVPYAAASLLRFKRIASLQLVRHLPRDVPWHRYTLLEIALSFLVWFFVGCTLFSVVVALSIPLSFLDIWFLTAIQLPLQLVPIQGVANAGNHEIGWVAGFSILGISPEIGLGFALASHVAIILYVALLGLVGMLVPTEATGRAHS